MEMFQNEDKSNIKVRAWTNCVAPHDPRMPRHRKSITQQVERLQRVSAAGRDPHSVTARRPAKRLEGFVGETFLVGFSPTLLVRKGARVCVCIFYLLLIA
ncbi:hypothetical protein EVAR_10398_1 [Eumeta japonica]|uniref:Uncharacterized protein n=1 Tax=Eumeta variegata TaxID=151549 RepID=A0A4C1UE15_EUMVA|nr:hypothetical protein EVAR_10398_1 [Eumeta japonica]